MDFRRCVYGGPAIRGILVGDSHASAIATSVQQALPDPEQGLLTFTYTSCPTIFAIKKRERGDLRCAEFNEWVMQEIATLPPEVPLIIVNRTSGNVFGSNRPEESGHVLPSAYFDQPVTSPTREFQAEFARRLATSACRIARERPVYLVRPLPEMHADVPKVAARKQLLGQPVAMGVSLADYHQRHALVWGAHQAHEDCAAQILDPLPWLCDDTHCPGLKNGRPLYYDSHHLSEYGNRFLVPMFQQVFHATDQHG